MPTVVVVATLLLAASGSLFMAWTIGAGSSGSTPFAPAVGANAIPIMRAGFLVGILGFLGAVLQGASVSATVGGGLLQNVTLSPTAAIGALFTAGVLVAAGVFTGYPIATAFTVTGAVTGVGIALGGVPNGPVYRQTVLMWLLIPFVGGGASFATARVFRSARVSSTVVVSALTGVTVSVVAHMNFTVLGPAGRGRSLAQIVCGAIESLFGVWPPELGVVFVFVAIVGIGFYRLHRLAPERTEQRVLLGLGGLVAFSAGATQVGLAVGPLIPLIADCHVPLTAGLLFGGFGLLLGSWTGAPRMIKALSQDYSTLGPKRSIAALVPAFIIAQTAVFLSVPVSFNEIIVSSILGSGFAARGRPISVSKMRNTVLAWVGSLGISGVLGYAIVTTIAEVTR